MKIMKLAKTLYFDDENYLYDDFKEAKENSIQPEDAYFVKKQKVMVYNNGELSENELFTEDEYEYYIFTLKGLPIMAVNNLVGFVEPLKE